MVIINSPHNPTGVVFDIATLTAIANVAIEHNLLVLSDEAYEHLTFDNIAHIPIATLPGMSERTITVGSAGKTFSYTGWKVGWATGIPELVTAVRTAKQFLTYVASGPFQYAIAVGLRLNNDYFSTFAGELQSKRDLLSTGLVAAGFHVFKPMGTYFITTDIAEISTDDALTFCRALPGRSGVVAVPNSVFYMDPEEGRSSVRFAFCKKPDVIAEAAQRLKAMQSPSR